MRHRLSLASVIVSFSVTTSFAAEQHGTWIVQPQNMDGQALFGNVNKDTINVALTICYPIPASGNTIGLANPIQIAINNPGADPTIFKLVLGGCTSTYLPVGPAGDVQIGTKDDGKESGTYDVVYPVP
jgi:hypothetical protein